MSFDDTITNTPQHYLQLDSLRAFAVAGVAWHHFMREYSHYFPFYSGVQLFFVLSGFLITGILLDAKQKTLKGQGSLSGILKNFYARRFLRIFPLYYVVLFLALMINVSHLSETWTWHFAYASNFYFIKIGKWDGPISHFWSLAVEEQFYLIWPFLILFISNRRLPYILFFAFLLAPIYRLFGIIFFPNTALWEIATPGSLDSLSLGAILAFYKRDYIKLPFNLAAKTLGKYMVIISCAGYVLSSTSFLLKPYCDFLSISLLSLIYMVIINKCIDGVHGPIGSVLNFKPLIYIGTISYGLYILHNFSGIPTNFTLNIFPVFKTIRGATLLIKILWTFLGAVVFWHFFEKPIIGFKKYFPYNKNTNVNENK